MEERIWYVRSEEGAVYGPATASSLLEWVKDGRVDPSGSVSCDRINWVPPQTLDWLEMTWLVEVEIGSYFGPFNVELVRRLVADGSVPGGARIYRRCDLPVERVSEPVVVEAVDEPPPKRKLGGIFRDADPDRLAALEAAARKELSVAKKMGIGGIFGRMKK